MGRKPQIKMGDDCPSCGAIWSFDEYEEQKCFCCGYPDVNEDNYPDEDEEYDEHESDFCVVCGCEPCDCKNKRG